MARILFYLPTVTPWWFDNIVAHMIRACAPMAEVHVIVPPLWRNTGIGPEQLLPFIPSSSVRWHIADSSDHPSLRTSPADPDALVELVRSIEPSHVFCRSADIATPARFPGKVRHLMEAGAPPLSTSPKWITLQPEFWHHGTIGDLAEPERQAIETLFQAPWEQMRYDAAHAMPFSLGRSEALESMGLPADGKIVALPLEYEHEEAFTAFHNRFHRNIDLVRHLVEQIDGEFLLAVTDHPLNYRHVDRSRLHAEIAALGSRVRLVRGSGTGTSSTDLLIKHCDGLVVQNTKVIYSGAFFGKPTLRLSNRLSAGWLKVSDDLESFVTALRSEEGGADEDSARLWFGYHVLHEIIDPAVISGHEILDRIDRPFSTHRLAAGLERIQARQRQIDLAA
jgi:hypothetical protein